MTEGQLNRVSVVGMLLCAVLAMPASAQIVHVWDLADVDQPGQLTIYNPSADDAQFGTPIRSGDLNGEGFDDFIVPAMAADGPPGEPRQNAGEVAVYFSPGFFAGAVDLARQHDNVVTVFGEGERDIFGIKTEVADVNGDGANDLLVLERRLQSRSREWHRFRLARDRSGCSASRSRLTVSC